MKGIKAGSPASITKVYLDVNVLIDLFEAENEEGFDTAVIVDLCVRHKITMCISLITVAIADYLLDKAVGKNQKMKAMKKLAEMFTVLPNLPEHFTEALNFKNLDIEDSLHFFAAKNENCDYIISKDRNFLMIGNTTLCMVNKQTFIGLVQQIYEE